MKSRSEGTRRRPDAPYWRELRSAAKDVANDIASARGEQPSVTFAEGLAGEIARFQVWRRLRRMFPTTTLAEVEAILDDVGAA